MFKVSEVAVTCLWSQRGLIFTHVFDSATVGIDTCLLFNQNQVGTGTIMTVCMFCRTIRQALGNLQ